jgi:hypothetical protein
LSPSSAWRFSRKLFSRKSSSSLRDAQTPPAEDERSGRSEGSRSRDISPESLRRFLVDDVPLDQEHESNDRPAIYIPEDIVEENEDDDNFATSAVSETMQYTGLSPPPQRAISPCPVTTSLSLSSPHFLAPAPAPPTRPAPRAPLLNISPFSNIRSPFSLSPESPDSTSPPGFYHSEVDEDIDEEEEDDDEMPTATQQTNNPNPFARNFNASLSTYSLPKTAGTEGKLSTVQTSPVALLNSPIPDSGLGDLMTELGWMADLIRGEHV